MVAKRNREWGSILASWTLVYSSNLGIMSVAELRVVEAATQR